MVCIIYKNQIGKVGAQVELIEFAVRYCHQLLITYHNNE